MTKRDLTSAEIDRVYDAVLPGWAEGLRHPGEEWRGSCPFHGGDRPSLAVNRTTGRWKCHSGECGPNEGGGDVYHFVMMGEGGRFPDAVARIDEILGQAPVERTQSAAKARADRWDGWRLVALPVADLPPASFKSPRYGMPIEGGPGPWYYTQGGRVLRADVRYLDEKGQKTVLPWTVWEDAAGNRKWRNKDVDAPRPLYGLDDLAARPDAPVLVVEGAKTADAGRTIFTDMVVVTWPGGSGGAGKADWSALAGRNVAMWPDADDAGMRAAKTVTEACRKAGSAAVRIVALPDGLPEGWDLADEAPEGIDVAAVLAGEAKTSEPDADADDAPAREWDKRAPENVAAELLAPRLRGRFRYHHGADSWMAYDERLGTWRETVRSVVQAAIAEAVDAEGMAPSGYGERYIVSIAGLIKRHLGVLHFSKVTGFANGVLIDGELVPHHPDHLLVNALPYPYIPGATCKPIIEWLYFAMKGDAKLVHVLRCGMHAMVNGRADFQVFFELLGAGGAGKGTFMRVLHSLVGEHASYSTDLRQMEENRFEAAAFRNKLLIQVNDADKYGGSVSMLKRLTGHDEIRVEEKGKQQAGSFRPTGIVVITVNEAIRSSDYTSGLARRRITIKFDNPIDMTTARDLEAEFKQYMPGLYNWVNEIAPEQVNRDLHACLEEVEAIAAVRAEVEMETNPIAAWANEKLFYLPGGRVKVGEARRIAGKAGESAAFYENSGIWLYASYKEWAEGTGAQAVSQKRFTANLLDLLQNQYKLPGINHRRMNDGYYFFNVTLTQRDGGEAETEALGHARARIREVNLSGEVNGRTERFTSANADGGRLSEPSEPSEPLFISTHTHMRASNHVQGQNGAVDSGAKNGVNGSPGSQSHAVTRFPGSEPFSPELNGSLPLTGTEGQQIRIIDI